VSPAGPGHLWRVLAGSSAGPGHLWRDPAGPGHHWRARAMAIAACRERRRGTADTAGTGPRGRGAARPTATGLPRAPGKVNARYLNVGYWR